MTNYPPLPPKRPVKKRTFNTFKLKEKQTYCVQALHKNILPKTTDIKNNDLKEEFKSFLYKTVCMNKANQSTLLTKIINIRTKEAFYVNMFLFASIILPIILLIINSFKATYFMGNQVETFFISSLFVSIALYFIHVGFMCFYNENNYLYNMYNHVDKEHHDDIKKILNNTDHPDRNKIINEFNLNM